MAVVSLAASAAAFALDAEQYVILVFAMTAAPTGPAFALQRRTPLDAAATTAGACLLVASMFDIGPSWVSGIWFAVGLQTLVYGIAGSSPLLRVLGAFTTLLAAASWWFTTGLDEWAKQLIEPADIRAGDVWMMAATAVGAWRRLAALLVGGTVLTGVAVFVASGSDLRDVPTWSWLAVGGLALLGVAVLIERGGKAGSADLRQLVDRWD